MQILIASRAAQKIKQTLLLCCSSWYERLPSRRLLSCKLWRTQLEMLIKTPGLVNHTWRVDGLFR